MGLPDVHQVMGIKYLVQHGYFEGISYLQLKTRVATSGGRGPRDEGNLARLDVYAEVGWRIGCCLYGRGPCEPIVDGTKGEECS